MADTRPVADRITTASPDHRRAHALILERKQALADRLFGAFAATPDPSCADHASFGAADGLRGSLTARSGGGLDWVIDSWIANPERGFCNHHLTTWLPATVKVPHLGLAIGTIPELFFFLDLVPRADLWVDTDELDRYHATYNGRFLEVAADRRFAPFISREPYIRAALSPVGLCVTAEATEANIGLCMDLAAETLERWIGWVHDAPPVAADAQTALATRDLHVRRTICERDPANVIAERLLGKPMTDALVRVMWGADR